jgi:hypothetical protein
LEKMLAIAATNMTIETVRSIFPGPVDALWEIFDQSQKDPDVG